MAVYLKWIADAWSELPEELIAKSFKICGISTALDGSEDHEILCFRPDGPIPSGLEKLAQARFTQNIETLVTDPSTAAEILPHKALNLDDDGIDDVMLSDEE